MLKEQEVTHLLGDGRALWLRVDEFAIAYYERYRSKARLAKYLSYATVLAAVTTALSTLPQFPQEQFTLFPAVLTAFTAAVSQILAPEKAQRENWDTWKKIEALKADLASRCRGLFLAERYDEEQTVFQNFNKHLNELILADISVSRAHKKQAEKNLAAASIEPIRSVSGTRVAEREEPVEEQESTLDAGITEMSRRGIA